MRRSLILALLSLFGISAAAQTRINAGGPAYTASTGAVWTADSGFNNGLTYSTTATIGGTSDQTLFQTQRYSDGSTTPLIYTFTEPSGTYTVNLLFSELYYTTNGTGKRVFSVKINSAQVLSNFDVFAKVGGNAADTETFSATSAGTITIEFDNVTERALIDAIEIVPGPPPPFVWVMPGLGTATFPMQIPPACGPSDGTCSIQIQVCDTSKTPPVCMVSSQGTITLLKNITLPMPQQQSIPLVTVTP